MSIGIDIGGRRRRATVVVMSPLFARRRLFRQANVIMLEQWALFHPQKQNIQYCTVGTNNSFVIMRESGEGGYARMHTSW